MQKLTVQSEDLRHQATEVDRGSQEVERIISQLGGQISQLAANWAGGASEAFRDRWDDWQRGARDIKLAMDDMAQFLKNAAEAYESTEQQIKSAAGR